MGWTHNTADADAPTIGPLITGVSVALTFLSLVTVCLRVHVRAFIVRAFGADDWIIVVTWICALGFAVVTICQTKWGLGLKHIEDLPLDDVYNFGLLQYMGAPFYITSILGFKLALLFSYLRFVPIGAYRITIYTVITACILFHISFLLVQVNLCQPARKQWDPAITYGSCIPGVPFYTSMASLTIVFDVTVMALPFPVLLKSHIQTRKKLILLGLFGLGIFITVIQIIRIQTIKQLSNYVDSAPLILWSAVENNLGIIVANVPTLAPLVKYYHEQRSSRNAPLGGESNNPRRHYNNYGYGFTRRTQPSANVRSGARGGDNDIFTGVSRYSTKVGSRYARDTWKSAASLSFDDERCGTAGKRDTLVDSVNGGPMMELKSFDDGAGLGPGPGSEGGRVMSSSTCVQGGAHGSTESILASNGGNQHDLESCGSVGSEGRGGGAAGRDGGVERVGTPGGITKRVDVIITRS